MLRLCIQVGSDIRHGIRERNSVTISFQKIWDEFGEFIRRNICGDTHIVVDVKRCVRRNTDVQFTERILTFGVAIACINTQSCQVAEVTTLRLALPTLTH